MSELITIARPYAKAAFDFAVEHKKIEHWQAMLEFAVKVVGNERILNLSYALSPNSLSSFFNEVCDVHLDQYAKNLIKIMAENNRLIALPFVLAQFIKLRDRHEMTMYVDVISASTLDHSQLTSIRIAMENRLSRKIELNCKINKSVIAGIIIRAGDLVIDGSIRGRLDRLANFLCF
ncbi:F0F1 ATP synthase subunit delta [Pantoea sp. Aalb]|uniref:F0F1 ATP synthase subunit delta n=1 Tax=Pantoea sp. Aalb TaxID=2576762 RepID=UPI001321FDBE|nr:F0F1 ATP synthase subunit delta [Pantoea sp. Aalb]MXP67616.1 F0F1 ATP synthase subunit delta [Pantoea sp. Aalb]